MIFGERARALHALASPVSGGQVGGRLPRRGGREHRQLAAQEPVEGVFVEVVVVGTERELARGRGGDSRIAMVGP